MTVKPRIIVWVLLTLAVLVAFTQPITIRPTAAKSGTDLLAGFRASRLLYNYPNEQFPDPAYWVKVGDEMATKFNGAAPGGVWIVSLYQDNGTTQLSFPASGDSSPYTIFSQIDYNEPYLKAFDNSGLKVWLQVEPGAANVDMLIDLVLQRYRQHTSVVGFGIDVEWYLANTSPDGRRITDMEAQKWEQHVKSINSKYTLFLKHWDKAWMPPLYRGSILFIDDSQQFSSLNEMVNEFSDWGSWFSPNSVAFQFGYQPDSSWWHQYKDPAKTIGDAILATIPNTEGLFWVDFTITQIFSIPEFSHMVLTLAFGLGLSICGLGMRYEKKRLRRNRYRYVT